MNTSSLQMIGPYRRRLFQIQAEEKQLARLANEIEWQKQRKLLITAAWIIGTVLFFAGVLALGNHREDKRVDAKDQIWRAEGYPVPK